MSLNPKQSGTVRDWRVFMKMTTSIFCTVCLLFPALAASSTSSSIKLIKVSGKEFQSCVLDVQASQQKDFSKLSDSLLLTLDDPNRLEKMLNAEMPSSELKEAAKNFWRSDNCLVVWIASIEATFPYVAAIWREEAANSDLNKVKFISGDLTIGEYNQSVLSNQSRLLRRIAEAEKTLTVRPPQQKFADISPPKNILESAQTGTNFVTASNKKTPSQDAQELVKNTLDTGDKNDGSKRDDFFGLSVFGSLNQTSTTAELTYQGHEFSGLGMQNTIFDIGVDYMFPLFTKQVGIIGLKKDLSDSNLLEAKSSNGYTASMKQRDHSTVYLGLGTMLSPTTLGTAKVTLENSTVTLNDTYTNETRSTDVSGLGYALSMRTLLGQGFFGEVEAKRVTYGVGRLYTTSGTSTGTTTGTVSIGKFLEW